MFAIIRSGGKQYLVREGDEISVDRLEAETGAIVRVSEVLSLGSDDGAQVGTPLVDGAHVTATVAGHRRAKKVTFFHYKNKTRQRRKRGHRQHQTQLKITSIVSG